MPKLIHHRTMAGIRSPLTSIARSVIGQGKRTGFSAPVRDYFARLGALRVREYDAANARLIDRLVANGGNFWPASGAFCAMAGYLYPGNGEDLIPLKDGHDAGTLNAFVSGDWNAVTGLKGDGNTKYVDSNHSASDQGQNDVSLGVYISLKSGSNRTTMGINIDSAMDLSARQRGALDTGFALNGTNESEPAMNNLTGLLSGSRAVGTAFTYFVDGVAASETNTSSPPLADSVLVFSSRRSGVSFNHWDGRSPFYHIGPNLNGAGELAELDTILTDWQTDLANA